MSNAEEKNSESFTQFLNTSLRGGDSDRIHYYQELYDELRKIAAAKRWQWNGNHTVGVTALVNETYLKLFKEAPKTWNNRKEFFSYAAKAMRHVLVNYSRDMMTTKRGGGVHKDSLSENELISADTCDRLLDIDQALKKLGSEHPRYVTTVEMKIFGGFTIEEIADYLDVGTATVKRDWKVARARLYQTISEQQQWSQ